MLIVFIILLKPGPRVDPRHVPGHGLSRIIKVTRVNRIFYCARSKNDIILIKK